MKPLSVLMLLAMLLALSACSGPTVRTDFDKEARFDGLQTFAWLEPGPTKVENPLLDSPLLGTKVQRAVVAELTNRGHTQVTEDAADFLVTYHTSTRTRDRALDSGVTVSIGFGSGHYRRGHRSIFVERDHWDRHYEEGSLILDVIDARTDRLVWRGWVSTRLHRDAFSDEAVVRAVTSILGAFPPQ